MPKNSAIKRTLVIGSGPIAIGQAAEFDYAGTQACQILREEGVETILVNSNPATIMTDCSMADHIYIEPLTLTVIRRIIEKEKPDSLLPSLGGQTGLNLAMQLAKEGFLQQHGVHLLAAGPDTIDKAEDRQLFKQTMAELGQPTIPSVVTHSPDGALAFAEEVGYSVIVRPAFTLGGSGGGIADTPDALRQIAAGGVDASPIGQILVEQSVAGWKEIEFEVMRDSAGNCIAVCSMENFDPVGVHTGDSIVVAPAVTLADKEYQMLRTAALDIIDALGIEGGCNCQFALNPHSFEYAVIEVNPRVSRSSALASKATGYPIAKVATLIALGYTLPEIENAVTGGRTSACFEPVLDYMVVKLPKWPFDKFVYAKRRLGTQMKATGEVMAIAPSFEAALMKAVRGAEIGLATLSHPAFASLSADELRTALLAGDDLRLFAVYASIKAGITLEEISALTGIDLWFLGKLEKLREMECLIAAGNLPEETYRAAKRLGFPDAEIEKLADPSAIGAPLAPVYKMVDTCAGEFDAETPYFYASYAGRNEAALHLEKRRCAKPTVIVFGSGPIRIGQGIEFDYASVHCVWALQRLGYEVVIVNNNPETVSTDFDTADRLYFEPLTPEDVKGIIDTERPVAVVVAFGGQTAIRLTRFLDQLGIPILGTGADAIDAAEDREQFDALLERLEIARPRGRTVTSAKQALEAAEDLGYPVLLRPSYVLGGQNMIIAFNQKDVTEYMDIILPGSNGAPILIDQYLMGVELEVDAICDGEDILIPGVMEHVERAGVHSGDSIAVYPAFNVRDDMLARIVECSRKLALGLSVCGLVNIQYLIYDGELYVIEVNPRSSRTIPYLSKVTGVPMVELAVRVMLGEKLADMGWGIGLYKTPPYVAVKVPVFSFEKLDDVDTALGPEMKSTGEVLGLASSFSEALYKGLVAAGYSMERRGGVLFSVKRDDRRELYDVARKFLALGCPLYATRGNAVVLQAAGLPVVQVEKLSSGSNEILERMENGEIAFVISTSSKGRDPATDSVRIRRKAVEKGIPCLTSIDTANALADCLGSHYSQMNIELVDLNCRRTARQSLTFTKMQACGSDMICIDCRSQTVSNPAGLGVQLCHRHTGVGGEGVALLYPSEVADFKMVMHNMDGSENPLSVNGVRMLAKYAYEKGIVDKLAVTVETAAGVRCVRLHTHAGQVREAEVDLGRAVMEEETGSPHVIRLDMGGPHAVALVEDVDTMDLAETGKHLHIPTAFAKVIDETTVRVRVWEPGFGELWAGGNSACAAVAAAVAYGLCAQDVPIAVMLRGGQQQVRCDADGGLHLLGPVDMLFEGVVRL